jgi:hypothetical protein
MAPGVYEGPAAGGTADPQGNYEEARYGVIEVRYLRELPAPGHDSIQIAGRFWKN